MRRRAFITILIAAPAISVLVKLYNARRSVAQTISPNDDEFERKHGQPRWRNW